MFGDFLLKINWAKVKSEALLRYRGKHASEAFEHRRLDGKLAVKLPASRGNQVLHVVDAYKHLGGHVTITSNLVPDAKHKASNAMSAYCPLATRVFGSRILSVWTKLHFMCSLILSRLLQNVHTWVMNPIPNLTL